MKTTKMMKSLTTMALVVLFTTCAFTQKPNANFVPKDVKTDNLLTGDNRVLIVIDWQQGLVNNLGASPEALIRNKPLIF